MTYRSLFHCALLAYLCWEIYWYRRVGLYFIKWHTHLMPYVFCWYLLDRLLSALSRRAVLKPDTNWRITLFAVFMGLMAAESLLMITGIGKTYMEKIGGCYASVYESKFESPYRTYPPDSVFVMDRGEFIHRRTTNALGFADQNWDTAKTANEIRILVLGDSFTEGVGAEQDESYPAVLQRLLQQGDSVHRYRVMNAGIQGSDPCVNAVNFKERLQVFRPDLVIQTLSSNDLLTDIAVKGGLERWQPDSTIRFRPGPAWEPLFAMNMIFRLGIQSALGIDELMRPKVLEETELSFLKSAAADCLNQTTATVRDNNARLIVLLMPNIGEIEKGKYFIDGHSVLSKLNGREDIAFVDLLPKYSKEFDCRDRLKGRLGIVPNRCNSLLGMHYWPVDGHHNSKGYSLLANFLLPEIKKHLKKSAGE